MIHKSALVYFPDPYSAIKNFRDSVSKAKELVSPGRFLITVFGMQYSWESQEPREVFSVLETLGPYADREETWEFFGNGAIRLYKGKSLHLSQCLQWNIIRKGGQKPYSRIVDLSPRFLRENKLPVSHKVFTRDVANNVWNIHQRNAQRTVANRFRNLLVWSDEDFYILDKSGLHKTRIKTPMSLDLDIVGVPTKQPYHWNQDNALF